MALSLQQFVSYRFTAAELNLSGVEQLYSQPVSILLHQCNGIGGAAYDKVSLWGYTLSDLLNHLFPWAVPACLIHDIRYTIGGTEDDRAFADMELWRNLRRSIPPDAGMKEYLKRQVEAFVFWRLVRVGAKGAWNCHG